MVIYVIFAGLKRKEKRRKRALHSLMEWYEIYKDNLLDDWNLAERHEPLNKIPPLE